MYQNSEAVCSNSFQCTLFLALNADIVIIHEERMSDRKRNIRGNLISSE